MTTKLASDNLTDELLSQVAGGPFVRRIVYLDSNLNTLDDLALGTDGGNVRLVGFNFSNVLVKLDDVTVSDVTIESNTSVIVNMPAKSAGGYNLTLVDQDTGYTTIKIYAVEYSPFPAWTTSATLPNKLTGTDFTVNLAAPSDSNVVYAVATGSTLPGNLTLASNGLLSGNVSVGAQTTYTFDIVATDQENQDTARTFSVTIIPPDPFFKNTALLLNADEETFITDASDNAFPITPNGDTRPSAFSPYNTNWSNYFDGTGDYLTVPNDADFDLTGEFTIEGWLYFTTNNDAALFDTRLTGSDGYVISPRSDGTIELDRNGSNVLNGTIVRPINAWSHFVIVRNASNNLSMFINGVRDVTTTNSDSFDSSTTVHIGAKALAVSGLVPITGYVSGLRIVKGTAVYDPTQTTITVPTSPLTAVSGTSLLTCQSNRLIDNSTNNFTITKNGDVKVTSFGPFTETDTSTGSGYFDRSADFLSTSHASAFALSGEDFTIEGWVYLDQYSASYNGAYSVALCGSKQTNGNDGFELGIGGTASSYTGIGFAAKSGGTITVNVSASYSFQLHTWYHVSLVKSGSTYTFYVNGTAIGSGTSAGAWTNLTVLYIGSINVNNYQYYFPGYISNFRLIKGTAITPPEGGPTAPLTAISGTSLLTLQNRIGYNNSQPIDESGIRNVITRNGNASSGSFSPFAPTGWSAYFDATGENTYINVPVSIGFSGSTNDIIEFDLYLNNLVDRSASSSDATFVPFTFGQFTTYVNCGIGVNGNIGVSFRSGSTFSSGGQAANGTITAGTWHHVKIEKLGTAIKLYVDDVEVATGSMNFSISFSFVWLGRFFYNAGSIFNGWSQGYLRNFKITQNDVVVLDTLRSNRFEDLGPRRYSVTPVTTSGPIRIAPFSELEPHTVTPDSHSVYFDGTGDYLTVPDNAVFDLPGDFTIECWVYPSAATYSSAQGIFSKRDDGSYTYILMDVGRFGTNRVGILGTTTGSSWNINFGSNKNIVLNAWNHLALVRDGTTITLYQNGENVGSVNSVSGTLFDRSQKFYVGTSLPSGQYFTGSISNFRFIKGTTLYTSNFTPPTSPLTAIANTSLLTCQSPTVVDNSDNAFAITVNGNSQPTRFNPFGETVTTGVEYSPALHGGSWVSDGTTDYYKIPHSDSQTLGTNDFTIEFWFYPTQSLGNASCLLTKGWGSYAPYLFYITNPNVVFYASNNGSSWNVASAQVIGAYQLNAWNHVVVTRKGSAIKGFMNGAAGFSISSSAALVVNTTTVTWGAADNGSSAGPGPLYYSGLNILNGRCLYESAFAPPQSPPAVTTNTVALINNTNAAIQDRTGRNVLETVGNARTVPESPYKVNQTVYFNGSSYLNMGSSNDNTIGTQACMVEAWVYPTAAAAGYLVCSHQIGGMFYFARNANGTIGWALNHSGGASSTSSGVTSTGTAPLNTWTHIAAVRKANSTEMRIYINGVLDVTGNMSGTNVGSYGGAKPFYIGAGPDTGTKFTGYLNSVRYVLGDEVYTSNFTVPSAPPDAITGTRFLVAHTRSFVDGSGNFVPSLVGTPQIKSSEISGGPFIETQASNATMAFDGTTSNLLSPYTDLYSFGTGDFTVEGWFYFSNTSTNTRRLVGLGDGANGSGPIYSAWELQYLGSEGSNQISFQRYNGTLYTYVTSGATITQNTWQHIAVSKGSGTLRIFVNGVAYYSAANSIDYSAINTNPLRVALAYYGPVAGYGGPRYWNGYIDDLRITKGVARYTANFTPPTERLLTL